MNCQINATASPAGANNSHSVTKIYSLSVPHTWNTRIITTRLNCLIADFIHCNTPFTFNPLIFLIVLFIKWSHCQFLHFEQIYIVTFMLFSSPLLLLGSSWIHIPRTKKTMRDLPHPPPPFFGFK